MGVSLCIHFMSTYAIPVLSCPATDQKYSHTDGSCSCRCCVLIPLFFCATAIITATAVATATIVAFFSSNFSLLWYCSAGKFVYISDRMCICAYVSMNASSAFNCTWVFPPLALRDVLCRWRCLYCWPPINVFYTMCSMYI